MVYVCEERGIDTSKIKMKLEFERDEEKHLTTAVHMHIDLPPDFPPEYKVAVIKTAKLCTVKRNIADPPQFTISATISDCQPIPVDGLNMKKIVFDPRYQAICLWNLGLFFEMHELLESIWQASRETERSALKEWIQAAGVYVLFQRDRADIARSLVQRAIIHLRNGFTSLDFIANKEIQNLLHH